MKVKKKKKSILPSKSSIANIESIESEDNVEITSEECFFSAEFLVGEIFDHKEYTRFIKNVEKHIRSSKEYKEFIGYLRSMGLNSCSILGNVMSNDSNVEIEMHHHPFTLYDIVSIVYSKYVHFEQPTNTFRIAMEVLKLHYDNLIGMVPLSITVHELVHAGEIFINSNQVFGYIDRFIDIYKDFMSEDQIEKYNEFINNSNLNISYSQKDILKLSDKIKELSFKEKD